MLRRTEAQLLKAETDAYQKQVTESATYKNQQLEARRASAEAAETPALEVEEIKGLSHVFLENSVAWVKELKRNSDAIMPEDVANEFAAFQKLAPLRKLLVNLQDFVELNKEAVRAHAFVLRFSDEVEDEENDFKPCWHLKDDICTRDLNMAGYYLNFDKERPVIEWSEGSGTFEERRHKSTVAAFMLRGLALSHVASAKRRTFSTAHLCHDPCCVQPECLVLLGQKMQQFAEFGCAGGERCLHGEGELCRFEGSKLGDVRAGAACGEIARFTPSLPPHSSRRPTKDSLRRTGSLRAATKTRSARRRCSRRLNLIA